MTATASEPLSEVYDGTAVTMTFTFTDEGGTLTDISALTVVIQPGYDPADAIALTLADLTHVSAGVYTYSYPTLGLTAVTKKPVEHIVQAQSTGTLAATTDPVYFTVLPPAVPILG